jgi:hypothetical protein
MNRAPPLTVIPGPALIVILGLDPRIAVRTHLAGYGRTDVATGARVEPEHDGEGKGNAPWKD